MNFMSHVTECDSEGAKMFKLSEKTADFGRFLQFFGKKKQGKCIKIWKGGLFSLFEFHKFARYRPNIQKPNTNMPEIGEMLKRKINF